MRLGGHDFVSVILVVWDPGAAYLDVSDFSEPKC